MNVAMYSNVSTNEYLPNYINQPFTYGTYGMFVLLELSSKKIVSNKLPGNVFFFSLYSTCVLNYVHISNAFLISKNFSLPETLNLTHYRVPLIRLKYTNST